MMVPDDEQILGALAKRGGRAMTYVVRNTLSMDYRLNVETSWVLRQLKRLEREGKVERVPTFYAIQICWATKPSPTRLSHPETGAQR